MLASTSPLLWYSTRATGTVTLVLLSAAVILGILTSTRTEGPAFPRFAISDLHRKVSLLATVFLGVHILTAVLDTYVSIGWIAVVVPFASSYQPFWIGLGAIAFDLLVAVTVTSLLRSHINAGLWRAVHWTAYALWPVAVIHGIGAGTDLRFGWMQLVVGLCLGSVIVAIGWRLVARTRQPGQRTAAPKSAGKRSSADRVFERGHR